MMKNCCKFGRKVVGCFQGAYTVNVLNIQVCKTEAFVDKALVCLISKWKFWIACTFEKEDYAHRGNCREHRLVSRLQIPQWGRIHVFVQKWTAGS
jgi:hypothetical protein